VLSIRSIWGAAGCVKVCGKTRAAAAVAKFSAQKADNIKAQFPRVRLNYREVSS